VYRGVLELLAENLPRIDYYVSEGRRGLHEKSLFDDLASTSSIYLSVLRALYFDFTVRFSAGYSRDSTLVSYFLTS